MKKLNIINTHNILINPNAPRNISSGDPELDNAVKKAFKNWKPKRGN